MNTVILPALSDEWMVKNEISSEVTMWFACFFTEVAALCHPNKELCFVEQGGSSEQHRKHCERKGSSGPPSSVPVRVERVAFGSGPSRLVNVRGDIAVGIIDSPLGLQSFNGVNEHVMALLGVDLERVAGRCPAYISLSQPECLTILARYT
jgi:hypothetical protein